MSRAMQETRYELGGSRGPFPPPLPQPTVDDTPERKTRGNEGDGGPSHALYLGDEPNCLGGELVEASGLAVLHRDIVCEGKSEVRRSVERRRLASGGPSRTLRCGAACLSSKSSRRSRAPSGEFQSGPKCHASRASRLIGPDVLPPPLGLSTLIGYVRQTITMRRTRLGAMPDSPRQPPTVVSRDVTWGYVPWCSERPDP